MGRMGRCPLRDLCVELGISLGVRVSGKGSEMLELKLR